MNVNVTRSHAWMMDIVALNMEASAMRLGPPQTITTLAICATSNILAISNRKKLNNVFQRVKNCTCWARQGPNECVDPQYQCRLKFQGECDTEKPSPDHVPTGLKCLSPKFDILFIFLLL